ncbi:glycoside hydrolase superfamily [Chytriomyces sp. MP71]|nr:glycoside hydrolase superfamily [Chytriomyces sp. MP71]
MADFEDIELRERKSGDVADALEAKQKRSRNIIVGIAVVVLVAAIGGGVGGYLASRKSSPASSPSDGGASPAANGSLPLLKGKLVGYYGQNAMANGLDLANGLKNRPNSDTTLWQGRLAKYCDTGFYHTINLAFLNDYADGNKFNITFAGFSEPSYGGRYTYLGNGVETNSATVVANFQNMGQDITYCQSKNVKIVMSLGGDQNSGLYGYATGDGERYAQLFTDMFMANGKGTVRPFGPGVNLDGFELDVEKNENPTVWNAEMIAFVNKFRTLNPNSVLAAVPQCFLGNINKDANTGDVISAVGDKLNYIIVQYYNNPQCSYPFGFNFASWKPLFKGSIFVGLAGDQTSAISGGFLDPASLQVVYDSIKNEAQFAGFSVYDVSSSNAPALAWDWNNLVSPPVSQYSQTLFNVLQGQTVGTGGAAMGPPVSDKDLGRRCGGSWIYANNMCNSGPACLADGTCANKNFTCLSYLKVCP